MTHHLLREVRGYHIQGSDEAIGHVEDFIVDDETWAVRYLVIDTSNWWLGKKVLVAPHWASRVSWEERKVHVDMSRQAIKNSPEWDATAAINREYEARLYDYYGRPVYWDSGDQVIAAPRRATRRALDLVSPESSRSKTRGSSKWDSKCWGLFRYGSRWQLRTELGAESHRAAAGRTKENSDGKKIPCGFTGRRDRGCRSHGGAPGRVVPGSGEARSGWGRNGAGHDGRVRGLWNGRRHDGRVWGLRNESGHDGRVRYGMGSYGMGPISRLSLSDVQRTKINAIADHLRKRHWEVMGKIMDDQTKLRDLYAVSDPDPKAIGAVYADISKLRQEMLETHVQAANQARALLTKEQREQLDKWRREGWRSGTGYRGMGMGRGAR